MEILLSTSLEWGIGKALDYVSKMIVSEKGIVSEITSIMDSVGKDYFWKHATIEWDSACFYKAMNNYIENKGIVPLMQDLKDLLYFVIDADRQGLLDATLIEGYRKECIYKIGEKPDLTNTLLLLYTIDNEEKEIIKRKQRDDLFNCILRDIKGNRKADLYKNISFLNSALYPYICNVINDQCSDEMVDIGYFLADIYDYTSEYEKSLKLSGLIKNVIMSRATGSLSVHQLRQLIGCVYSFIIVKCDDLARKEAMLIDAENDMKAIKNKYLDSWSWSNNADRLFVNALYASNYGALLINKAEIEKKKENLNKRTELLQEALEWQKQGEVQRKEILSVNYYTEETGTHEDVERYYYKSKSNIASVLYQLGQCDESVRIHRDVLDYWSTEGDTINIFTTKSYIIGCYIQKIKNGTALNEEIAECRGFINECKAFYAGRNDRIRLKDIVDKEKQLTKYLTELK